jgi:SAM-dependent methyltransferase
MSTPTGHPSHDRAYWDDIASEWHGDRDVLWRAHSDAVNSALCRRWLPATCVGHLLKTDAFDEASGSGLTKVLAERAVHVVTMDLSPAVAARARARHVTLSALVADVRVLPFADAAFDVVVSNSTLDHFEDAADIARSLREIHRVLVPGGRLLLTLDNLSHPVVWLRSVLPLAWLMRWGLVPYFVGATLGPAATAVLVASADFRVLEVTTVLHCPRVLAIPVARAVATLGPSSRCARWLRRALAAFETAERWPTRVRTGHFVAVLAERR